MPRPFQSASGAVVAAVRESSDAVLSSEGLLMSRGCEWEGESAAGWPMAEAEEAENVDVAEAEADHRAGC
jgi:hypothetical protein